MEPPELLKYKGVFKSCLEGVSQDDGSASIYRILVRYKGCSTRRLEECLNVECSDSTLKALDFCSGSVGVEKNRLLDVRWALGPTTKNIP